MLIGASTASVFDKLGIDGGFKMFRDAGMNCVDFGFDWYCNIWKFRRGDTEGNIFTRPQEEITEFFRPFKEAADKYGIKIHQAHAPCAAGNTALMSMYAARALSITIAAMVSSTAAWRIRGFFSGDFVSGFIPSSSSGVLPYSSPSLISTPTSGTPSPLSHLDTDLSE